MPDESSGFSSGIHLLWGSCSRMNVLVVEDEVKMAALIRRGLSEEGLTVDVAERGEKALGMERAPSHRAIAPEGVWTPVLMLPARGALEDRVAGWDGGADDYLTKPFSFAELLARLRALVRRGQAERPGVFGGGEFRPHPAAPA